jgi:hypothetical protein
MSASVMSRTSWRVAGFGVAIAAVGVGCFFAGRLTAPTRSGGYLAGYTDGQIAGVEQGRLYQGSQSLLPADAKSAKDAYAKGYTDGANDAFILQFDGGWKVDVPYIVTVTHASNGITYRFSMRDLMEPGKSYYSCAKSVVCAR